ncbi:MAG: hypothetical protein ACKVP7_22055 [Hyphomicrobiaceae bacterium]
MTTSLATARSGPASSSLTASHLTPEPLAAPASVAARFHVVGDTDPGLLPRLLEPIAKLGATPMRVHASREAGDGSEVTVDLRLGLVAHRMAEQVESALRRVIGVRHLVVVLEPIG